MDDQEENLAKVAMTVYGVRSVKQVADDIVAVSTTLTRLDKSAELSAALVRALLEINAEVPEHNRSRRSVSEPIEKMLVALRSGITTVETDEDTSSESP